MRCAAVGGGRSAPAACSSLRALRWCFPLKGDALTKYIAYLDLQSRELACMDADLGGAVGPASGGSGAAASRECRPLLEYLDSIPLFGGPASGLRRKVARCVLRVIRMSELSRRRLAYVLSDATPAMSRSASTSRLCSSTEIGRRYRGSVEPWIADEQRLDACVARSEVGPSPRPRLRSASPHLLLARVICVTQAFPVRSATLAFRDVEGGRLECSRQRARRRSRMRRRSTRRRIPHLLQYDSRLRARRQRAAASPSPSKNAMALLLRV